jgi:hypothetical protein
MDGMRIMSLTYIHTTSDDQRSFFYLPASTRTPHRVRLLHPLCFHSPCCIATGSSEMAPSFILAHSPSTVRDDWQAMAVLSIPIRSTVHSSTHSESCVDILILSRRVLVILRHFELTFDCSLFAFRLLSAVPFMCYLMVFACLYCCYAFVSHLLCVLFLYPRNS